jgi:WD40 repeat protein
MTAKITFIKATDHQSMIIQVNNRKIARFSINDYSIHWILDSDSICLVKCSHNQQFLACIDIQHIRIVNMQNGSHDRIINHNHTEKVHGAAISHNDQMIATASWDNRVHVIDIANNTVIANLPHSFDCNDVDFTLDDSHVITAADTRNVDRWCIETGLFVRTITSHDEWVIKSNVAPNGRHMISQCKNQVKVIDLQEDTVLYTKTCQSREMIDVVFSHDCSMYFLKTTNNTIEGWMISSGQRCFSRTLPSISITSMNIDQSGQIIYIGTSSGSIMCWNISTDTIEATIDAYFMQTDRPNHRDNDTGTAMVITGPMQPYPSQTLGVHTAAVRHLAYDSGGRWIASASSDGSACVWPTDQPEQQAQRLVHHSRVRRVAVAGDGSTFSAADDGVLRVWDATGLCRREIDTSGGWITELMICAADTLAVTISRDRAIRWWSLGDGMLLGCSAPGTIMPCDQAAATSDGRVVFWCGEHSLHRIALEADGSTTAAHIAPDGGLSASAIDPDRGCIATGSRDGTVRVWQWGASEPVQVLHQLKAPITSVAFNGAGTALVAGDEQGNIAVWRVIDGMAINVIKLPGGWVMQIRFIFDDQWLACASRDRRMRLWRYMSRQWFLSSEMCGLDQAIAVAPNGTELVYADGMAIRRIVSSNLGKHQAALAAQPPQERTAYCGACGDPVAAGVRYCEACGTFADIFGLR